MYYYSQTTTTSQRSIEKKTPFCHYVLFATVENICEPHHCEKHLWFWCLYLKKDMMELEEVQGRATKTVKRARETKRLGLFNLERSWLWGDTVRVQYHKGSR